MERIDIDKELEPITSEDRKKQVTLIQFKKLQDKDIKYMAVLFDKETKQLEDLFLNGEEEKNNKNDFNMLKGYFGRLNNSTKSQSEDVETINKYIIKEVNVCIKIDLTFQEYVNSIKKDYEEKRRLNKYEFREYFYKDGSYTVAINAPGIDNELIDKKGVFVDVDDQDLLKNESILTDAMNLCKLLGLEVFEEKLDSKMTVYNLPIKYADLVAVKNNKKSFIDIRNSYTYLGK